MPTGINMESITNLFETSIMCFGGFLLGAFLRKLAGDNVWPQVLMIGSVAILIATIFEFIAVDFLGRDPGVMFYLVLFICVLILAIIENTLGMIAAFLSILVAFDVHMGKKPLNLLITLFTIFVLGCPTLFLIWINNHLFSIF